MSQLFSDYKQVKERIPLYDIDLGVFPTLRGFYLWWNMKIFLLLLFFVCSSWASCFQRYLSNGGVWAGGNCSTSASPNYLGCKENFSSSYSWTDSYGNKCELSASCPGIPSGAYNCVYGGMEEDGTAGGCGLRWRASVTMCTTECEADSVRCVKNSENQWRYTGAATCGGMECVEPCDSTFNCIEYPFEHCVDVPSNGEVQCTSNGCSGLSYSKWWSEYRVECTNECGEHKVESISTDTLITFGASCDDSTRCSEEEFCVDFPATGTYAIYVKCQVGNNQVGNNQENRTTARLTQSGKGSCADNNLDSDNFPNSNNDTHDNNNNNNLPDNDFNYNDNDKVSDNCLIYGVGCPDNWIDTTDYYEPDNRIPSRCSCEPLDGSKFISRIICPDGSISTFFGSCEEYRSPLYSSSSTNPPESSSSGSENPPTSSGGAVDTSNSISAMFERNFEQMKAALGAIITNTGVTATNSKQENRQSNKIIGSNTIKNGVDSSLSQYKYNLSDSAADMVIPDSMYVPSISIDTSGLLNAIFHKLENSNSILDTIPNQNYNGCPCITFFQGNTTTSFNNGIRFKEIKIDFSSLWGVNLCTIIRSIVVAFASVVSFFIGFSIFKNVSQ